VAGIEVDTGEWVRPVPSCGGAIPLWLASSIALLDVVDISLSSPRYDTQFQRENRVAMDWAWRVVGKVTREQVIQYCQDTSPFFFSEGDRVMPALLSQLPPQEWKSLQLVRPGNVVFEKDHRNDWRASFRDNAGNVYCLKVKDPCASGRLDAGGNLASDCLLTLSLAEP